MDGVRVALDNRGMMVEAAVNQKERRSERAQKIRKSGEPWYICN